MGSEIKISLKLNVNLWAVQYLKLDEEAYVCDICDKRFPDVEKLEEHEMLHDDVKYGGVTSEQGEDQVSVTQRFVLSDRLRFRLIGFG